MHVVGTRRIYLILLAPFDIATIPHINYRDLTQFSFKFAF